MALVGDPGVIEISDAARTLVGCADRAATVGRFLNEFSPERQPDGREPAAAAHTHREAAFATSAEPFERTHRRLDGGLFRAEALLSPVVHGGDWALWITNRDVRLQHEARERLEASEPRHRLIADENARLLLRSQADAQTNARLLHEANQRVKDILGAILSVVDLEWDAWLARPYSDGGRRLADLMGRVQAMAVVRAELSSSER